MVVVDASALATNFEIFGAFDSLEIRSFVSSTSTSYAYTSFFGNAVTLTGSGFSVGASNNLTSGNVTSISIDLDNDGSEDITITGLSLLGADLYDAAAFSSVAFWDLVLDGPTQVIQGDFEFDFSTDFIFLESGTHIGSDDAYLNGADVQGNLINGDAVSLEGTATLIGGDDSFDTADLITGDVLQVLESSMLVGGDDDIVFTIDYTAGNTVEVVGDVGLALGSSTTEGGNDLIDLRLLTASTAVALGDVAIVRNTASVTGGDDILYGGDNFDLLAGDALDVEAQGSLTGGDDILYGGGGNDDIYGDYVNNTSTGQVTGGDDQLFGEAGNDRLFGNEGDDILEGGSGADVLDGGDGFDTASYVTSAAAVTIDLTASTASGGDAVGDTFVSIENIDGSNFADTLTGDGSNNVLTGNGGEDILLGGLGRDTLFGGGRDDLLEGGGGADVIDGGNGFDTASYESANNSVVVNLLRGEASGSHATGDTLTDIEGLIGSSNGDTLTGGNGTNELFGGEGRDDLGGFKGDDFLYGEGGNDFITGGDGGDFIDGGAGVDTLRYSASDEGVNVNLATGEASGGHADGDTVLNIEKLFGSSFDDTLVGNDANNRLFGLDGDDSLSGGAGTDKLFGGEGADSFVFAAADEFVFIMDWEDDVDILDLSDFGYSDIAEALANMTQVGDNVRFSDGDNRLLILDADLTDIADDVFIGDAILI